MSTQSSSIQRIREEEDDGYSDDSLFNIKPWGADLSFRELIDRYDDDELVKPELQRNYVWDRREASRFIDSFCLACLCQASFWRRRQMRSSSLLMDSNG